MARPKHSIAETQSFDRRTVLLMSLAGGSGLMAFLSYRNGETTEGKSIETRADPNDVFIHGWYPSWEQDENYTPQSVSFDKHNSFSAFSVVPNEDGEVVYSDQPEDPTMLSSFKALKRGDGPASDTPIHLTIGGWGDSKYFSNAALTEQNRERFAHSAISMMREYDLDGIDIDWEYPTVDTPPGGVNREEDVDNVVLLLKVLRENLDAASADDDRNYTLTYAAPHQRDQIRSLRAKEMDQYIDYWIVMAFEMTGEWASETRHDFPNYSSDAYDANDSMGQAMSDWVDLHNIRRDKLVIETGFYGKEFGGVSPGPRGDGLGQPFEKYLGAIGRPKTAELEADSNWETYWDEKAEAAYMYNESDERWITYAKPQTMETKVSYLFEEGFAGITGWETSRDPDDELLDTLRASVSNGPDG